MLQQSEHRREAPVWLQGMIIVGSMTLSVVVLCVIGLLLGPAAAPDLVPMLRWITILMTMSCFIGAFVVGNAIRETTRAKVREGALTPAEVDGQYRVRMIIMAALLESPGLLAGVVIILGGGLPELAVAGVIVLALLFILPTPSRYERFLAYVNDQQVENPYQRN